jgi:hypothetical protein
VIVSDAAINEAVAFIAEVETVADIAAEIIDLEE